MSDSVRTKAAKRYATARPDLGHQLEFFSRIWDIQDEFEAKAAEYAAPSAEDAKQALRQHQTLLSVSVPAVPLEPYRDAVRAIAAAMAEGSGLAEEQTKALAEVDLGAAVSEESLASALSGFDVLVTDTLASAGDERLTEPLVSFILTEAITPFLKGAAKAAMTAVGKYDWLQWDSGLCPACGTPASSGVIRDEGELQGGRRWLSCPLCRAQWEYARLRCARCGTRNQDDLEYLYDNEDTAHRVHTCKNCHGYTPVAFEKELRAIAVPEVEEVVMVRLETAAAERGFSPLGDETDEPAN